MLVTSIFDLRNQKRKNLKFTFETHRTEYKEREKKNGSAVFFFGYSQNTRYEIMMHANLHIGIFNRQLLRCTYNMIKFFFFVY